MDFANQFPTEQVPLAKLHFNIDNPRWNHTKGPKEQSAVKDYTFEHSYKTRTLKKSIAQIGLKQPLLVQRESNGFRVWDGNTRLACLQAINSENGSYAEVPCFVLPASVKADEIEAWLESQHGYLAPKPYNSFNRLERIRHLHNDCKWSYDDIRAHLGVSNKTIQRAVVDDQQHALTREYIGWVEKTGKNDPSPWRKETFFRHALNNAPEWLQGHREQFFEWLSDGKFRNSNSIGKDFITIVSDPKLSKQVEERGYDATLALVSKPRA